MRALSAEMDPLGHRSDVDSFWEYVERNRAFHALLVEAMRLALTYPSGAVARELLTID